PESRAELARVQRARAARGVRRAKPAARTPQVPRDLLDEPGRVLHGSCSRIAEAGGGRRAPGLARRDGPAGATGRDLPACGGAAASAAALPARAPPSGARQGGSAAGVDVRPLAGRVARGGRLLRVAGVPGAHAVGRGPRSPLSIHLESLALAGGGNPGPRARGDALRTREDAAQPAEVGAFRTAQPVRAPGGGDRCEPRIALPGDGRAGLARIPPDEVLRPGPRAH